MHSTPSRQQKKRVNIKWESKNLKANPGLVTGIHRQIYKANLQEKELILAGWSGKQMVSHSKPPFLF